MKFLFINLLLFCCSRVTIAQNNTFTFGPAIGLDQFISTPKPAPPSSPGAIIDKNTLIHYKTGLLYGLEASYSLKRLLVNARLLTTKRLYEVTSFINYDPNFPVRVAVKARYYSLPFTVSYLLKHTDRSQLYAGVGLVPEWISGDFNRVSYAVAGSGRAYQLEPEQPTKAFSLGSSIQMVGRYSVSRHLLLQAQPAWHYFQQINTPFATTDNSSFSLSISVAYKLN
jgi:hypothetical protein